MTFCNLVRAFGIKNCFDNVMFNAVNQVVLVLLYPYFEIYLNAGSNRADLTVKLLEYVQKKMIS